MKPFALTAALIFSACSGHAAGMAVTSTAAQPPTVASPAADINRSQGVASAAQVDGQEAPAYALWALGMGLIGFKVRRRART